MKEGNMILNALSSVGAYADLWSHLKSMDYALERALDSDSPAPLEELDKERLQALANFLSESIIQKYDDGLSSIYETLVSTESRQTFAPDFDLRERFQEVQPLKSWHHASKIGFEKKIQKLIESIDYFLNKSPKGIFKNDVPREEFEILRALLTVLLSETQSALYL